MPEKRLKVVSPARFVICNALIAVVLVAFSMFSTSIFTASLRDVFKPGVAENSPGARFTECAIRTFTRLGEAFSSVNCKTVANNYEWNERFDSKIVNWGIKNLMDVGKLVKVPAPTTGKMGSYIMVNDFTAEGIERILRVKRAGKVEGADKS